MRTIMVFNSKGGSGKSTLAINLASFYACWGIRVTLMDFDPQCSGMDWLRVRSAERPRIYGIAALHQEIDIPRQTDYVIMDLPAGLRGERLERMLSHADAVLIPVLPSPLDIRAVGRFLLDFARLELVQQRKVKVGMVANRVKENTLIYHDLERCLQQVTIPLITHLRESQNYIRAAERGLGIFEMPTRQVAKDLLQWQPLIHWLNAGERLGTLPPIGPVEQLAPQVAQGG